MKVILKIVIAGVVSVVMMMAGRREAIAQLKKTEPSTEVKKAGSATDLIQNTARVEIKKEALPKASLSLLEGDGFKGWTIAKVYRVKVKDEKGIETDEYEVEVKKDNLNQILKFDKDGNLKKEERK